MPSTAYQFQAIIHVKPLDAAIK